MAKCLLCGAGVWYVGLVSADCENSGCANYREPPRKKKENYGSWAWARKHQRIGWQLEWRDGDVGDWTVLDEDLSNDQPEAENEPYVYRLRQDYYEVRSVYKRGSLDWACDQERLGGHRTHRTAKEYEIVP